MTLTIHINYLLLGVAFISILTAIGVEQSKAKFLVTIFNKFIARAILLTIAGITLLLFLYLGFK